MSGWTQKNILKNLRINIFKSSNFISLTNGRIYSFIRKPNNIKQQIKFKVTEE